MSAVTVGLPDEFSDVILLVEDKRLYTSRALLAAASPVWRQMLTSNFKEKDAKEIPLPGKRFDDVQELLLCIHPGIQKALSESTYMQILPLADEYQMSRLRRVCEQYGMKMLSKSQTEAQQLDHLIWAQTYNQPMLLDMAIDRLSGLKFFELQSLPKYSEVENNVRMKILLKRVTKLENTDVQSANYIKVLETANRKHESHMHTIRSKLKTTKGYLTAYSDDCSVFGSRSDDSEFWCRCFSHTLKKIERDLECLLDSTLLSTGLWK